MPPTPVSSAGASVTAILSCLPTTAEDVGSQRIPTKLPKIATSEISKVGGRGEGRDGSQHFSQTAKNSLCSVCMSETERGWRRSFTSFTKFAGWCEIERRVRVIVCMWERVTTKQVLLNDLYWMLRESTNLLYVVTVLKSKKQTVRDCTSWLKSNKEDCS